MSIEVIVHFINEDPVVAEIDELPDPTHQNIVLTNPRRRDGRSLHYITEGARAFIFPWSRISFTLLNNTSEEDSVRLGGA